MTKTKKFKVIPDCDISSHSSFDEDKSFDKLVEEVKDEE